MSWLVLVLCAWGQDDPDPEEGWGDDEVGFAEVEPESPMEAPRPPSPFSGGGTARSNLGLWAERLGEQPWARARQSVDVWGRYKRGAVRIELSGHAEIDLPYWVDRDRYDEQTVQTYAWQLVPREALVAVSAGPVEVVAGRQLIVWGEGLLLSPVDIVAARDLRDPGLADLDDLRLPVLALRLESFWGSHRFSLIGVPESDWGYRSPPAGPYGSVPALLEESDVASNPLLGPLFEDREYAWTHQQPRFAVDQLQGFARWRYAGKGYDLGLYAASVYDKSGTLALPTLEDLLGEDPIEIPLDHARYTMLGHSGTAQPGPLLVRWEAAIDLNRPFNVGDVAAIPAEIDVERAHLVTLMGGIQIPGIPRTTVDVEVAGSVFPQTPEELLFPVNSVTYALRATHHELKERLRFSVTGLGFGHDLRYGGLVRGDVSYELGAGLLFAVGGIVYRPGSERGPLLGLDRHDQIFAQLRYDFAAP